MCNTTIELMCHVQVYGIMEKTDLLKKYRLADYLTMLLTERLHNAKSDWKLFMNGE
jgi:hypothetical protein